LKAVISELMDNSKPIPMNINVTPKIAKTKLDLKNIRFTQLLFPTNS